MYLKRLELQGFKSFADKTVLEFRPGITTVIGPNGSGKSNISDAIRWVLGEQSMKSLRGAKSEDIIFAGTQNRKSLGFAEASIVFDNTDSKLPVEYTEVTVTRKIYRSGESGYFINKTPCRLKDILELFMDTGIGKDGYSIIGQGKIDEILSNKSEDRRHIFEEAAGIVKYRTRKMESEKKLEQTKLNLLRINDILSEIEGNIAPLKAQSEKAKKYLELREELKKIEVGLFGYQIESNKEKLQQIQKDEEILVNQNEDEQKKQNELNKLKDELKAKVEELTNSIESMQNIGFESQKEKERIYSEISISKERIQNNTENFERYTKEIEEIKEKIEQLKEEEKQKQDKKINLTNNKEKFEKELKEKQEELEKLTKKLSEKELEIEDKKQIVEKSTDEKYEKANEISTLTANYENLEKREKTVKYEIQTTISELDQTRTTKEEIAKVFYEIEAKRNKITKQLEESSKVQQESTKKLKEYEDTTISLSSQMRMKESRLKFLQETQREKEGYTKSVKALLTDCEKNKELSKGVHGILADLMSVDKQYETAIEMCLGQSLQNIVTDTEEDAKRLVEHLRKNNLGRASFLPIISVKGKKIENIKRNKLEGVIGIASDLVKSDSKYNGIILNLLGRTVIVDDMPCAIELAKQNSYSFRIITLKGDIINSSGAITGGSVTQKTVNILGRAREIEELEELVKNLQKQIEKNEEEKNKYSASIETVLEEVEALQKDLQEIDITYATDKQKLVAVEENIQKLETRLAKLKEETQSLVEQKEEITNKKAEAQKIIDELETNIKELNTEIEQFASLNKDNQAYVDNLNLDITNLKISVSSFDESQNSIEEIVERIKQDITNHTQSIENKEKQKTNIQKENEDIQNNIKILEEQLQKIDVEVGNSASKVEELKEQRMQTNSKLDKTEEEITSQFKVIEGLKEQIVKIDVKKTKIEQDLQQIVDKLWEEYELTPNSIEEYGKPDNIQTTTKEVNQLRNKIRDLGSINIDSIEEYKETAKRYDFMCEQRLDLENTMGKLKKVIQEMTQIMKEQFKVQFETINKNFKEVFKELFGGGDAQLVLTDEENILECGIDINVQPPGKKLQSMTLLSGGEKAFTAIALLFAILKINPAPFCVLDEIEAALDDVNVYRYADYLKKFSKNTQFLVITHRKGTMEAADTVYGVTMEENGISKLLSMKMS